MTAELRHVSEEEAVRYERSITFFFRRLDLAEEKVAELEIPYQAASDKYTSYLKNPDRDVTGIKSVMREVKNWAALVAAARKRVDIIDNKIDENIKKLTFGPIHSLCARVNPGLPRELRDNVYRYLYSEEVNVLQLRTYHAMDIVFLRYWIRKAPEASSPLTTMRIWLGDSFAHELVEHWYCNSLFSFGTSFKDIKSWLQLNVWGSPVVPAQCIKRLEVSLGVVAPGIWPEGRLSYIQCQLYGLNKNATLTVTMDVNDSRHYGTHRVRKKKILGLKQLVTELYPLLHDMAENLDTIKLKLFESDISPVPAVTINSKSTLDSVLKGVAETYLPTYTYLSPLEHKKVLDEQISKIFGAI